MAQYHKLDLSPVPKEVLYVNELNIADSSVSELEEGDPDLSQDDNVRIYIPLDVNQSAILRRLELLGYSLGDPNVSNEMSYTMEVQRIITELEIYDQVWYVREGDFSSHSEEHHHSKHARELVDKILDVLKTWSEKSFAEHFPSDQIDELEEEYGLERDYLWEL